MNATTTTIFDQPMMEPAQPLFARRENPWVSDHVLLSISVWWVRMTQPSTPDFSADVAVVFNDLQRNLQ